MSTTATWTTLSIMFFFVFFYLHSICVSCVRGETCSCLILFCMWDLIWPGPRWIGPIKPKRFDTHVYAKAHVRALKEGCVESSSGHYQQLVCSLLLMSCLHMNRFFYLTSIYILSYCFCFWKIYQSSPLAREHFNFKVSYLQDTMLKAFKSYKIH